MSVCKEFVREMLQRDITLTLVRFTLNTNQAFCVIAGIVYTLYTSDVSKIYWDILLYKFEKFLHIKIC